MGVRGSGFGGKGLRFGKSGTWKREEIKVEDVHVSQEVEAVAGLGFRI